MPGFGDDPFGNFPFGGSDWAHRIFWGSVPLEHQNLDVDGLFESMFKAVEAEADILRREARDLPLQRDPYKVRNNEVTEDFDVLSAAVVEDPDFGVATLLTGDVGAQVDEIVPGWLVTTSDGKTRTVLRIFTWRDPDDPLTPNEVTVTGDTVPTIAVPPETLTFRAPSLLKELAKDFGFEVDEQEPDFLQRSSVANIHKWWAIKASAKSYAVRGDIAGFNAEALGLYRIQQLGFLEFLPAERTFELPPSSGQFYTDIDPRSVRFDEIAADVDPVGFRLALATDDNFLYEDSSFDGKSEALAWSEDVAAFTATSVTALTPAELAVCMLPFGWKVTGSVPAAELARVGWMGDGAFGLVAEFAGVSFPIETEFVVDKEDSRGAATLTVIVGSVIPPETGPYHVKYFPQIATDCSWCRSHSIVITLTPSQVIIDSGVDLTVAAQRLIAKFDKLIPIHVRLGDTPYSITIAVDASDRLGVPRRFVSVDGSDVGGLSGVDLTAEYVVPRTAFFDDIPGDAIPADENGPTVTDTIVITPP